MAGPDVNEKEAGWGRLADLMAMDGAVRQAARDLDPQDRGIRWRVAGYSPDQVSGTVTITGLDAAETAEEVWTTDHSLPLVESWEAAVKGYTKKLKSALWHKTVNHKGWFIFSLWAMVSVILSMWFWR